MICGIPLIHYDHLLGWANVRRHVDDEITLLCAPHDDEKTRGGLLPDEEVKSANANPFNLRTGTTRPYALHYSGRSCEIVIGSNFCTSSTSNDVTAVMIDGVPLLGFRFEDGHYLLQATVFNEHNEEILEIRDNQLVVSTEPWDVTLTAGTLTLRSAHREILFEIHFDPPNRVSVLRGRFLLNDVEALVSPEYVLVVNKGLILRRVHVEGFRRVAIQLGNLRDIETAIGVGDVPRNGVDLKAAITEARKRLAKDHLPLDLD